MPIPRPPSHPNPPHPNPRRIAARAGALGLAAVLLHGCGGGEDPPGPDPAEGVWESRVTPVDCSTGAAVVAEPFRSQQTLHDGGAYTETSSHGPLTRSLATGQWRRVNAGYEIRARFYPFAADGTPIGSTAFTTTIDAVPGRGPAAEMTARRRSEVRDMAGNLVATRCFTETLTRF